MSDTLSLMGPSSITESLSRSLHYHPDSYWCPDCWKWRLDCEHLVEALERPHVKLNGSIHVSAAYERERRILEVRDNCGHGYQYYGVSLELARQFARSENPGKFMDERMPRRKFNRVRGRR
jgi:hypothetical protein